MKTALVWLAVVLAGCTTCGCRGGLFGGSANPAGAKLLDGIPMVNAIINMPNADSTSAVGSVGVSSPYLAGTKKPGDPANVENPNMGAYVTTPVMPATGATYAATGSGLSFVIIAGNAGRESNTDLANAMQMLVGNRESVGGQGQAPGTKGGVGGAGAAPVGTVAPVRTTTGTIAPPVAGGDISNPIAATAGPGSTPGAVSGGTGDAGSPPAATTPGPRNYDVIATDASKAADGAVTVMFNGGSVTGTATGPYPTTDGSPGTVWRVTPATGPMVAALLSEGLAAKLK